MRIVDLLACPERTQRQIARLLVTAFAEHWPDAWPDEALALAEVRKSLSPGRVSRVALAEDGAAIGWISGLSGYDGLVWELHPLVVDPSRQGEGIGRALVADLEAQVASRGALTLMLGSDDEDAMTSLGGVDLFPAPWEHLAHIQNLKRHPYGFYEKLGFVITGVVPDANGFGKPDILMAKRVAPAE
jgi:aminoglycoside 6'-N-acetyltransferase I